MVKVDVISGFLGAGKTTLIKKLFSGKKTVIRRLIIGSLAEHGTNPRAKRSERFSLSLSALPDRRTA